MNPASRAVLEQALTFKKATLKRDRERRAGLADSLRTVDGQIAQINREIFALEGDLA